VNLIRRSLLTLAAISLLVIGAGCSERNPAELDLARGDTDPLVYEDGELYGQNVYFQAFLNTHINAVRQDSVYAYGGLAQDGARSLKINVPPAGSSLGIYSGGVLTATGNRDLADYNALTFYARCNETISLDIVGFGNDNTGNSLFEAGRGAIPLGPDWAFVVIPIPAPSKLVAERGMFTFAEGREEPYLNGYDFWVDEIKFAKLGNIEIFRPSMPSSNKQYFVGSTVSLDGTRTVFRVDGAFVPVDHSPGYFDYVSSDPAVAAVEREQIRVVGEGTSQITATLEETPVLGTVTVTGYAPPPAAAVPPTLPASDVLSMFSDVYTDVLVDTWRADWGGVTTQVQDIVVAGDNVKMYTSLNWVGIEFRTVMIDASQMTHFHMDVYAPAGTDFKAKLVSFPTDGAGIESNEVTLNAESTPPFVSGGWVSLDIPLADFEPLTEGWDWAHLGQLVLSTSDSKLVLVDNIYFHK